MHCSEDYSGKKALVLIEVFYISEIFLFFFFFFGKAPTYYFPDVLVLSNNIGCIDPQASK